MEKDFAGWLDQRILEKGWSQSEAARRGKVSSQMINAVVNGQARPGLRFCRGIAQAFHMPLEEVLRIAGILPGPQVRQPRLVYRVGNDADTDQLLRAWQDLEPEDREIVLALVERLAAQDPRIIGDPPEETGTQST